MKSKKKEIPKKPTQSKSLENIKQKLFQAEASGDTLQVKVWKAILAKLEGKK